MISIILLSLWSVLSYYRYDQYYLFIAMVSIILLSLWSVLSYYRYDQYYLIIAIISIISLSLWSVFLLSLWSVLSHYRYDQYVSTKVHFFVCWETEIFAPKKKKKWFRAIASFCSLARNFGAVAIYNQWLCRKICASFGLNKRFRRQVQSADYQHCRFSYAQVIILYFYDTNPYLSS